MLDPCLLARWPGRMMALEAGYVQRLPGMAFKTGCTTPSDCGKPGSGEGYAQGMHKRRAWRPHTPGGRERRRRRSDMPNDCKENGFAGPQGFKHCKANGPANLIKPKTARKTAFRTGDTRRLREAGFGGPICPTIARKTGWMPDTLQHCEEVGSGGRTCSRTPRKAVNQNILATARKRALSTGDAQRLRERDLGGQIRPKFARKIGLETNYTQALHGRRPWRRNTPGSCRTAVLETRYTGD